MTDRPLRLLNAEDVELVAEAFEALLSTEPAFTVVARVGRGDHVLPAVERHRPDVALLDVDMPGATGIEAAGQVTAAYPECKVVLLTPLPVSGHVHRALTAGASGYLVKATTGHGSSTRSRPWRPGRSSSTRSSPRTRCAADRTRSPRGSRVEAVRVAHRRGWL